MLKKRLKRILQKPIEEKPAPTNTAQPSWQDVLLAVPGVSNDAPYRVAMTVSCRDCDYIPKVKNAGSIKMIDGKKYQLMHNGLLVEAGGYFGDWMGEIITQLKGHHEPQEEKIFHEVLKLLPAGSSMIELGSYWSYYSLWFNKAIEGAANFCCEPDPVNLALGQRNAKINNSKNITFIQSAAGSVDGEMISFKPQEGERDNVEVPIRTIDSIIKEYSLKKVAIVHMDVQGIELEALRGAEQSVKRGKIRFLIISTHHYLISGDLTIHEKCIDLIREWGGIVITEHAIHESFSGDGLILASFDKGDSKIDIDVSANRLQSNLFRSYISDMRILADAYEKLRNQ